MADNEHTKHDLDVHQQRDARERSAPNAAVVYESIRREAASELTRPLPGLAFSALGAGLSMGFSFLAQALLLSYTPDARWGPIIASFGYSMGFLFVILGRQQLFTENTLTPVLEVLRARRWAHVLRTLELWGVVLVVNIIGTAIFAAALAYLNVIDPNINGALAHLASEEYGKPFVTMFVRAIFAGWLVALMVWLMPFASNARVMVIILVTYIIGLAQFPHIIAGSVAALYGVFATGHGLGDFFVDFFVPTLIGNMVGGILLVAVINYAQVAYSNSERYEERQL